MLAMVPTAHCRHYSRQPPFKSPGHAHCEMWLRYGCGGNLLGCAAPVCTKISDLAPAVIVMVRNSEECTCSCVAPAVAVASQTPVLHCTVLLASSSCPWIHRQCQIAHDHRTRKRKNRSTCSRFLVTSGGGSSPHFPQITSKSCTERGISYINLPHLLENRERNQHCVNGNVGSFTVRLSQVHHRNENKGL